MKKNEKRYIRFLAGGVLAVALSAGIATGVSMPVSVLADDGQMTGAGQNDEKKLKITRIAVDNEKGGETAAPGEKVRIRALSEEKLTGVSSVVLEFQVNDGHSEHIYLFPGENDIPEGHVTIGDNWSNGSHKINKVYIQGTDGSMEEYDTTGTDMDEIKVSGSNEKFSPPEVKSVSFDRDKVRVGEYVRIDVDVTHETELEEIFITFKNEEGKTHSVHIEDGKKSVNKDLNGWSEGTYTITKIEVIDKAGNKEYYEENDNLDDVETKKLSVSNDNEDKQGPVLRGVRFDEEVTGSDTNISMNVTVDAFDSSGVSQAIITLEHESGEKTDPVYIFPNESGILRGSMVIDHTWLNGRYDVCEAKLTDDQGNEIVYTKTSDPSLPLIVGFYVRESKQDREPPRLQSVDITGTDLKPGDVATVIFRLTDASDIAGATVNVYFKDTNDAFVSKSAEIREDGSYICEIPVTNQWYNGEYDIRIYAADVLQNDDNIMVGIHLIVSDSPEDYQPPVFIRADSDKKEATAGDIVEITAEFEDASNIDHIYGELYRVGENGELIEVALGDKDDDELSDWDANFFWLMERQPDGKYHKNLKVTDHWKSGKYVLHFHTMDEWGNYKDDVESGIEIEISGTTGDRVGPVVTSFTCDKDDVKPGDLIKVRATAEDPSGVESIRVIFSPDVSPEEQFNHYNPGAEVFLTATEEGDFEGTLYINNMWLNAGYYPAYVEAVDNVGNVSYDGDGSIYFTVSGSTGLISPLHVSSILFDKEEVRYGESVNVTATVTGQGEVKAAEIHLAIEDQEAEGYGEWGNTVKLYPAEDGTLKGSFKIDQGDHFWKKDKTYGVLLIYLLDDDNNARIYIDRMDAETPGIDDLRDVETNFFTVDTYVPPVVGPADYSEVVAAKDEVPENLDIYTDETREVLQAALDAVIEDKLETEQLTVDKYAEDIRAAIAGLEIKNADYSGVDAAIAAVPEDLDDYTEESVKVLNTALESVVRDKKITEQQEVDGYAKAITDALAALELKEADYSAVDAAIAAVPEDLDNYTEESVNALNTAIDGVVRGKNITEQQEVDGYAKAITDAIAALELKEADYSAVDAVIAAVPADLEEYTEESVNALRTALEGVVRGKKITEQQEVDGYVEIIQKAIEGLEKKPAEEPEQKPEEKPEEKPETKPSAEPEKDTKEPPKTETKTVTNPVTGKEMKVVTTAKKKAPATGDQNKTGLWTAFGILAGIGGSAALIFRKRRKE